jgi:hypothetical protein
MLRPAAGREPVYGARARSTARAGAALGGPGGGAARHGQCAVHKRADAKVGDLGLAGQADQDVCRLDVAVHLRGARISARSLRRSAGAASAPAVRVRQLAALKSRRAAGAGAARRMLAAVEVGQPLQHLPRDRRQHILRHAPLLRSPRCAAHSRTRFGRTLRRLVHGNVRHAQAPQVMLQQPASQAVAFMACRVAASAGRCSGMLLGRPVTGRCSASRARVHAASLGRGSKHAEAT